MPDGPARLGPSCQNSTGLKSSHEGQAFRPGPRRDPPGNPGGFLPGVNVFSPNPCVASSDRETASVGFVFSAIIQPSRLKSSPALMLRFSRLASFFTFFSVWPIIPSWAGDPRMEAGQSTRPQDTHFRHIRMSLHNHPIRRGGGIDHNRGDRLSRSPGAITPSRRRLPSTPVFPASELPKSRRRHSSRLSIRQVRPPLAVSSRICD